MQRIDAHLIDDLSGLMRLGNEGKIFLFLGCAIALFAALHLARRCFRALVAGASPDAAAGRHPGDALSGGIAAATLEALESRLRAVGIAETLIPARLRDAAGVLAGLRAGLAGARPGLLALIDSGDFPAASAALKQDCDLMLGREDRDPDEVKAAAEICAAAAAIDHLNLDFQAAAEKYAAAAQLVAGPQERRSSGGAEWRYRMAQAQALVDDGAARGVGEVLLAAIETYDRALDTVARGETPLAWAATHFHLGGALLASGVGDNAICRVEAAVASYHLALEEWTQDATPFDWARTQHNLGDALQQLAEMQNGIERLGPAADAYRAALREWTRSAAPELFALAQGDLGDVLAVIGAQTGDETLLREAISAYQAALGELRRELAPEEWARMQKNLGSALEALAEHEFCDRKYRRDQLIQAVEAFESALEAQTPDSAPVEFAATSVNLGDALLALGEGEWAENPSYGADLLRRAAAAYRAALATPGGRAPVDNAKIKINLAYALGLLWNGMRDRQMLKEALAMLDGAISMLKGTQESQHVADAERARDQIVATLAQAA
jgi:tetratricopeptide (TPR) repeat protein